MKFVVLTANSIEHRFVVDSLSNVLGDDLVAVIIEENDTTSISTEIRRLFRKYSIATILERLVTKLLIKFLRVNHRKTHALEQVLGQQADVKTSHISSKVHITKSLNGEECISHIKNLSPDYILVYGTGIVSNRILDVASVNSFNLHTSISPYYRGSSSAFWPLYNGDVNMVGSTVHLCTAEIDGGDIAARASAQLDTSDDVHTAFAKAVHIGGRIYSDVARKLANGESLLLQPQDFSLGVEYKFSDRTFIKELVMEYRTRRGKLAKAIAHSNEYERPFES